MEIVTVADAVALLEYLNKRTLLCDKCGESAAEYQNQFHSRCKACKAPHAQYEENRVITKLERHLVSALKRWTASYAASEGRQDTGDVANSEGNGKAQELHHSHMGTQL